MCAGLACERRVVGEVGWTAGYTVAQNSVRSFDRFPRRAESSGVGEALAGLTAGAVTQGRTRSVFTDPPRGTERLRLRCAIPTPKVEWDSRLPGLRSGEERCQMTRARWRLEGLR